MKQYLFLCVFSFSICWSLLAQLPDGYYHNADRKMNAELKTALFGIIRTHTKLDYYASSTYFRTTDWHPATQDAPDGYFWDMYSSNQRLVWSEMNREHSLPKSWWSADPPSTVAYSDLHNLYPSDAKANNAKSNYCIGEVTGTPKFDNGVVKVGTNGFAGYTGTVFEPASEYKGDFARDYMYMVTCYEDYAPNWRSIGTQSILMNNTYPVFKDWGINLLLKWHRQDPVSQKELDRNDSIYKIQGNRNPFVDHPEFAEFIWGQFKNSIWTTNWVAPEEELTFRITPYPYVDQLFRVHLNSPEKCVYFIRNLNGVIVKTGSFSADSTLNISNLQNGMYFLQIYTTFQKRVVRKIIVNHQ